MPSRLIVFYIIYFLGFVGFSTTIPIIPLYLSSLGSSVSETGVVVSLVFYVAALLMIPFGMLSDRLGKRNVIVVGLFFLTVAPVLYIFANTTSLIIAVRIVHGLGLAMFIPSSLALVVDLTPPEKRGEASGWAVAAGQLGMMFGPLTGGFLLNRFDFNGSFYGCFFIMLIGLLMVLAAYKFFSPHTETIEHEPTKGSWGWLKSKMTLAILLIPLMMALGSGSMNTFLPLYWVNHGISETGIGLIITVYYAGSSLLRAPFGRLTDHYGARPVILGGFIVFAIGIVLFSLFHNVVQLSLVAAFFGLGFGMSFPGGMTLLANLAPPKARGTAMAIYTSTFQIGLALGTTLMGFIIDATSFETMFRITGITIVCCTIVFYVITRSKQ